MRTWSRPRLNLLLLIAVVSFSHTAPAAETAFEEQVRPLLAKYCFECHGLDDPQAELSLAAFRSEADLMQNRRQWKRVWEVVRNREMPPEDEPHPTDAEREQLTEAIFALLRKPDPSGRRDPGHVAARRLNAAEYNNTLFDLFAVWKGRTYFDPRNGMPKQVRLVLHRQRRPFMVELPPDDVGYGFDNIGEVLSLPPFLMEKYLRAASHAVGQVAGDGRSRSRMFALRGRPQNRETAEEILARFVSRAFRRPAQPEEVQRYLALFDLATEKGEPFADALKVPIQAVLISPHFLFRVEHGVADEEENGVRPLSDHELATRLSYFLWSTMPDEELFRLADAGKLRDPRVLEQQTRRMLLNPKSKELGENFLPQWLGITGVEGAMPDMDLFPDFYRLKYLPQAMKQEALLLFETIVAEDRSVLELVDPDFAWLNGTLLVFYGIDEEKGRQRNAGLFWHRYPLKDKRRGGILAMAAPLLATSNATRTSPVRRGKWILQSLLAAPPPPPPPNVSELDEMPAAESKLSLREKLEVHRANPACASCHRRMDPLGFALENYDAIGVWREKDGEIPIEPGGQFLDGTKFSGPVELKEHLTTTRRRDFLRSLTEHMLTYALGRPLDYFDAVTVEEIVDRLEEDGFRMSRLIVEIVQSYPFRYMTPAEGAE